MSKQMTEDWIEQEYESWQKNGGATKLDADISQYIARAFALHMLKKSASLTSKENNNGK